MNTAREGSLEAPTRHPIAWRDDAFYDKGKCLEEMERVFDICHGCRRCVSLCHAFPTLFDLVDGSESMEVDGVKKDDYWKVVDQCYLCDLCFMTKCPYVPPHPWNVDFPHLMLRGKAIQFRNGTPTRFRDVQLASTDRNGRLAGIPVVVEIVNRATRIAAVRTAMHRFGVHKDAWLPAFSSKPFRSHAGTPAKTSATDGERTPGKVAIFATCYVNYNEPGIGHDLVKVLEHNGIDWRLVDDEACCGMPKLELGDLDSVAKLKDRNIPKLAALARDGYGILAPIPSCALMFKQELPLMYPGDADVEAVRGAMFDPFEYLVARRKDGLLKEDFKAGLGNVSYHIACHLRVQNIGQKTRELLSTIPGTTLHVVERCSGHAGTWGVKTEFHERALKIGRPVFRQMAAHPGGAVDSIASDCALAGHHIEEGIGAAAAGKVSHPLSLLARAYGY
jgi:Fe-S oxidoreductase